MRERFLRLCPECPEVTFGTFHSVFFRILRKYTDIRPEDIINDVRRKELIRKATRDALSNVEADNEMQTFLEKKISFLKNMGSAATFNDNETKAVFNSYNKLLKILGLIDLDDILGLMKKTMQENAAALKEVRSSFPYILIDEFQDINPLQYETIKLIAGKNPNLFVVGDDDQAIYSFRGADPLLMRHFLEDYPNARVITLSENHRCPHAVVEASSHLIEKNSDRMKKSLFSKIDSGSLTVREFANTSEQDDFIAQMITNKINSGADPTSIAILFRSSYQPRALKRLLSKKLIPFCAVGEKQDIYDTLPGRVILSYLAASKGDCPREAALAVIGAPRSAIPRGIFLSSRANLLVLPSEIFLPQDSIKDLECLARDLKRIGNLDPYAAIRYLRKKRGLDGYFKELAVLRGYEPQTYTEIMDELEEDSKGIDTYAQWCRQISDERATVQNMKSLSNGGVRLLTFHASKGLEFDTVFIINTVEGIVPDVRNVESGNLQEERRMFYVALTRTAKDAFVLYEKERCGKAATPSRFIKEMKVKRI